MRVDVTVVGDVNIDLLTAPIQSYPKKDAQIRIPSMMLEVGGGAARFALTIAKLGLRTKLIGLIGDDVFGKYLIGRLKEFGIEGRIKKSKKESTGITLGINFDDSSKSLLTFRGTNAIFSLKDFSIDEIDGTFLFLGGYNLTEQLQKDAYKIFARAKDDGMLVGADLDFKSGINCDIEEARRILKLVDFLFLNLEEGKLLTSEKNEYEILEKILKLGCKIVVLKLGSEGCLVADENDNFRIRGLKVKAVNTTGAGDVFNAAFAFSYSRTKDLKKAGIFANVAAAFSTTKFGPEKYPTESQVLRLMETMK